MQHLFFRAYAPFPCPEFLTDYILENSSFLKRERSSTIHPHEIERDGMQARNIAFTGGMAEKQMGPKKMTKVTTSMANNVIFSFLVLGGVRKIFVRSISTCLFSALFICFFSFYIVINSIPR